MTPAFFSSSWKVVPDRDAVEDRVDGHLALALARLGGRRVFRALDAGEHHLLLQRDAELLVGLEELRIHLVERLRLLRHALRPGVVILILEVDLGVVDEGPLGLLHLQPALVGLKPPVGHPLRLAVLFGDEAHDVGRQALRRIVHLDVGFPAVLVLAADLAHGLDRLAVDAFLHVELVQCAHRSSPRSGRGRRPADAFPAAPCGAFARAPCGALTSCAPGAPDGPLSQGRRSIGPTLRPRAPGAAPARRPSARRSGRAPPA